MTLKEAYVKIDNLCCLNHNARQKEFFEAYAETQDEDFCKDVYEMVRCLDTISDLVDIEEKLGCPITVRERAFKNGFYDENGNHYICEHYVPYLKSMHTRGISMCREKHFKLKDYKKTWWLKKDKSE